MWPNTLMKLQRKTRTKRGFNRLPTMMLQLRPLIIIAVFMWVDRTFHLKLRSQNQQKYWQRFVRNLAARATSNMRLRIPSSLVFRVNPAGGDGLSVNRPISKAIYQFVVALFSLGARLWARFSICWAFMSVKCEGSQCDCPSSNCTGQKPKQTWLTVTRQLRSAPRHSSGN